MSDPFRYLVIANQTCTCPGLTEEILSRVGDRQAEVLVVAPALNSRLRHYMNDDGRAIMDAEERLALAVALLDDAGIMGHGEVGDADPLNAIQDANAKFMPHAVLVSTWPEGASHWLERDLVDRARQRINIPVEHFVSRYNLASVPAGDATATPA